MSLESNSLKQPMLDSRDSRMVWPGGACGKAGVGGRVWPGGACSRAGVGGRAWPGRACGRAGGARAGAAGLRVALGALITGSSFSESTTSSSTASVAELRRTSRFLLRSGAPLASSCPCPRAPVISARSAACVRVRTSINLSGARALTHLEFKVVELDEVLHGGVAGYLGDGRPADASSAHVHHSCGPGEGECHPFLWKF